MQDFDDEDCFFKVIIVGNVTVGKTSIFLRFTKNTYQDRYQATMGVEFGNKTINLHTREGGRSLKLQLWDTAGSERYKSMARSYYKGAVGAVLVYDITDEESFSKLSEWLELINTHLDPKELAVTVLGNKADMEDERQVSAAMGKKFADENKFMFKEVSAKTGANVQQGFEELARAIYNMKLSHTIDNLKETLVENRVSRRDVMGEPGQVPKSSKKGAKLTSVPSKQKKNKSCC